MDHRIGEVTMEEIEAQVARISESLFTSKASPDPDWYLNASLDVMTIGGWDTYARGYKRAADILVQYVIDSDWDQNLLVYPIGFLYRQYLELRLKELILMGSKLLHKEVSIPTHHRLGDLWKEARANLEDVWPDSGWKSYRDLIGDRIRELCSLDSLSYAFRYPEDKEGAPTLAGTQYINLKQLRDVIQGVSRVLDGASIGIGEELNARHEMMAEYQAQMRSEYGEY